jgi:hypothetical protein
VSTLRIVRKDRDRTTIVELDGQSIAGDLVGLSLAMGPPGEPAQVILSFSTLNVMVEHPDVRATPRASEQDLLRSLGWTPPGEAQ